MRIQSFLDLEVWVVGDGCTDDSERVVAAAGDDRFRWLNLPHNSGTPSRPRNEGLSRARGRYIAYLGHDDLWFPRHLEGLVRCAGESGCDFAYSLGAAVGRAGMAGVFSLPGSRFELGGGYSPSNWLHRRELVEAIGLWSEKADVSGDLEFLNRVFKHRAVRRFHDELTVLKFPAVYWKLYSLPAGADLPQAPYLESMKADAPALRDKLLQEAAARALRYAGGPGIKPGPAAKALGYIRYFLRIHAYQHWPLNRLSRRRYRRRAGLD